MFLKFRNRFVAQFVLILILLSGSLGVIPARASSGAIPQLNISTPSYPIGMSSGESKLVPYSITESGNISGEITSRTYRFYTQYDVPLSEWMGPYPASIKVNPLQTNEWDELIYLPESVVAQARSMRKYTLVLKTTFTGKSSSGTEFSTQASLLLLLYPAAFNKVTPANGGVVWTTHPPYPPLNWRGSVGAIDYEYCFDTIDNDSCDTDWTGTYWLSTYNTKAALQDLPPDTTFYWQVRANNMAGSTYANNGNWWSFTTERITPAVIFVKKEGSGSGMITSDPGGIDCGVDCSEAYISETPVTLSAVADDGSIFIGWGGDCDADGAVMMNADKTCIATFDLVPTTTHAVADFDGDGDTDISYFRPSTGRWYMVGKPSIAFGASGDIPVPADYDGDGDTDISYFRPSNGRWYILGQPSVAFGASGDIPVPGDYDGGDTDIAYYRPSTGRWYVLGHPSVAFGMSGAIPVPGDYGGTGKTDFVYFLPSNNRWYILGQPSVAFGASGAIPVPADYNGDGKTELAYFLPSNNRWYILGQPSVAFGASGAIPVPGDYDGDGDADLAYFLPSNGRWYMLGQPSVAYGMSGDFPLPVRDTNGDGDPYQ